MQINWKAVWLPLWIGFLALDQVLGLRARLAEVVVASESAPPELFYRRLETGLLVVFVLVAAAPFLYPLFRRWLIRRDPESPQTRWRDARDMSVWEALSHIARQSAWGAARSAEPVTDRLAAAATLIEEAARDGRITIRGRPVAGAAGGSLVPIDPDYWKSGGLDLSATLDPHGSGGRTEARVRVRGARIPLFDTLVVDRRSVAELWPPDTRLRRLGRGTARGVTHGLAWSVGRRRREPEDGPEKPKEGG